MVWILWLVGCALIISGLLIMRFMGNVGAPLYIGWACVIVGLALALYGKLKHKLSA